MVGHSTRTWPVVRVFHESERSAAGIRNVVGLGGNRHFRAVHVILPRRRLVNISPGLNAIEGRPRFADRRNCWSNVCGFTFDNMPRPVDAFGPDVHRFTVETGIGEEDGSTDVVHDLERVLVVLWIET